MVVEHLKRAWQAYKKNFRPLVTASILMTLITTVIVIPGVIFSIVPLAALTSVEEISTLNAPLMVLGFVMFFIGIIVGIVLQGGYIAVGRDALKKKAKVMTMFDVARSRWKSIIGTSIIKALIFVLLFLPALIVGLVAISLQSWSIACLAIILGIAGILVSLLFNFNTYAVVLDRIAAMEGIRKSYRIVRPNYIKVFILSILVLIIAGAATLLSSLIPFLGSVVAVVFVAPFVMLTWTSYYLSKKK